MSELLAAIQRNQFVDLAARDAILLKAHELALQMGSRLWVDRYFKSNTGVHLSHICSLISLLASYNRDILFAKDKLGGYTLHRAVNQAVPCVVAQLLKEGALSCINVPDLTKRCPLAKALLAGNMPVAKLLLESGADLSGSELRLPRKEVLQLCDMLCDCFQPDSQR